MTEFHLGVTHRQATCSPVGSCQIGIARSQRFS